jgi:hypothetical protein
MVRQVLNDNNAHENLEKAGVEIMWIGRLRLFRKFRISSYRFFLTSCLFLKSEIDVSSSNFTWSIRKCISIKRYQTWCIHVLYASLNTTLSPQTATRSSVPKIDPSSNKFSHLRCHSVDTKH